MKRKLIAIVPAAGIGRRAGAGMPKQYRRIGGRAVLHLAVAALLQDERISQVRVATAPGDARAAEALDGLPRTLWRACGGPTRAATVAAALEDACRDPQLALTAHDWVLVHDAARPGLPADALRRLITQCMEADHGGLLALPVADSVKRASVEMATTVPGAMQGGAQGAPRVQHSVSREGLWLAQTPQMFPLGVLRNALAPPAPASAGMASETGSGDITDEASAAERLGYAPLLVLGSSRNFKLTWPDDFDLMAKWLE